MSSNARPANFKNTPDAAANSDHDSPHPVLELLDTNRFLLVDRDPYTDFKNNAGISRHLTPDVPAPTPQPNDGALPTGGHFLLEQNVPNPFGNETVVPFTLSLPSDVRLSLFDPQGRKVTGVWRRCLASGLHHIHLNLEGLGLPPGDYSYELQVTNRAGLHRQRRTLTTGR